MPKPLPLLPLIALLLIGLTATAARAQSDVEVEVQRFGVDGQFRPGEHVPVRVELLSSLAEPTPVWVQLEVPNADGDVGEFGRSVTLSGGQPRSLWLYAPLPPDFDSRTVLVVRVFEEREGRRAAELGAARFTPTSSGGNGVPMVKSMMAVVGPSHSMYLRDYTFAGVAPDERPPFGHEDTRVVAGVKGPDLPDRWEGLKAFEAIAWAEQSPRELSDAQVGALREYIQRGGHLIISLGTIDEGWGLGSPGQSRFEDLLISERPRRDLIEVSALLPVTSKRRQLEANFETSVAIFGRLGTAADAFEVPEPWQPLIALPDGRVIVIQRTFGFGRITLVGIDLADRRIASLRGAVQGDIFWNRILGRRIDTPDGGELNEIHDARWLHERATESDMGGGGLIADAISMSLEASRGLLAALFVIIAYWCVAAGSFFVLRHYKLEKHAWLAFAASAGVFTAAAWLLVTAIKQTDYNVQHLTYLDMLSAAAPDEPPAPPHRAVSWFSLNMPGYRRAGVFIESEPEQRDLLSSWAPPDVPVQPFPNPDRYRVDVGNRPADEQTFLSRNEGLAEFRRPSRATSTQLYANWMGTVDPDRWGGIIRTAEYDPLRVERNAAGDEVLRGTIEHDLPGELTDVLLVWVKSNRYTLRRYATSTEAGVLPWVVPTQSGLMLNSGGMWARGGGGWAAGEAWSLGGATERMTVLDREIYDRYIDDFVRNVAPRIGQVVQPRDRQKFLEMLSFFNQLRPPKYLQDLTQGGTEETAAFFRKLGRELDLSAWFNGPCVIVMGRLVGAPSPIPLRVNGDVPEHTESSITIVRWIHPLPLIEEVAFPEVFEEDAAAAAALPDGPAEPTPPARRARAVNGGRE